MTMTTEKEIRDFYGIRQGADRFIKRQLEAHKRNANTPPILGPTPHFVASTPAKKSVLHLRTKEEKTPALKEKRQNQSLEVLKAFIEKPSGYTDAELVSARIGGTDEVTLPREPWTLSMRFWLSVRSSWRETEEATMRQSKSLVTANLAE